MHLGVARRFFHEPANAPGEATKSEDGASQFALAPGEATKSEDGASQFALAPGETTKSEDGASQFALAPGEAMIRSCISKKGI